MDPLLKKIDDLQLKYAVGNDTDFAVYLGDIERESVEALIRQCFSDHNPATNVTLMLATRGGDPHAAYRFGRALQIGYKTNSDVSTYRTGPQFTIYLPTLCKSAGTMLATAASKILMSGSAELGPIDTQLRSPSEVGERTSVLTPNQALDSLRAQSRSLFRQHFIQLRFDQDLAFSTKMAVEIATKLTVGLLNPMYAQLDPIRLAEVERSLKMAGDYTERLTRPPTNVKSDAVQRLLGEYPSHGFIIDRKEADELFEVVEAPTEELTEISTVMGWLIHYFLQPGNGPYYSLATKARGLKNVQPTDKPSSGTANGEGPAGTGKSDGAAREVSDGKGRRKASRRSPARAKRTGTDANR